MIGPAQIPNWFHGGDSIIDSISVFILLLISFFALKYYRIKKNKNHLLLSIAFVLLAVSFLVKIVITSLAYAGIMIKPQEMGLGSTITITFLIYFLYHLIALFGLLAMYLSYQKQSKYNIIFITYLIFFLAYFSNSIDYFFNLTYFFILLLITSLCIDKYIKKKRPATKLLIYSFVVITLSQLFFVLSQFNGIFYIVAQFIQLIGYLALLIVFIAVLIYGRKEDKDRYHW